MNAIIKLKVFFIAALVIFLPFAASVVQAITFEDLVQEGKKLLGVKQTTKSLAGNFNIEVTSDITLTENGDVNKNGEMDGGDTVRFSFTISNGTDEPYPFSNLKTNIKRDWIHFIHNIKGVTGIDNNTLELPNIYVLPHSKMEISFDAQLNYSGESVVANAEKEVSSQPLLEDSKKQKLSEGVKKIKKYKPGPLKDGSKTILKENNPEESAVIVPVDQTTKNIPSLPLDTKAEEASLTSELNVSESASPSAQENGNENAI